MGNGALAIGPKSPRPSSTLHDPFNRTSGPQTQRNYAWRDYGLRVGVWRVFDMLDELNLPATILLNSLVCEYYPDVVDRIKAQASTTTWTLRLPKPMLGKQVADSCPAT